MIFFSTSELRAISNAGNSPVAAPTMTGTYGAVNDSPQGTPGEPTAPTAEKGEGEGKREEPPHREGQPPEAAVRRCPSQATKEREQERQEELEEYIEMLEDHGMWPSCEMLEMILDGPGEGKGEVAQAQGKGKEVQQEPKTPQVGGESVNEAARKLATVLDPVWAVQESDEPLPELVDISPQGVGNGPNLVNIIRKFVDVEEQTGTAKEEGKEGPGRSGIVPKQVESVCGEGKVRQEDPKGKASREKRHVVDWHGEACFKQDQESPVNSDCGEDDVLEMVVRSSSTWSS